MEAQSPEGESEQPALRRPGTAPSCPGPQGTKPPAPSGQQGSPEASPAVPEPSKVDRSQFPAFPKLFLAPSGARELAAGPEQASAMGTAPWGAHTTGAGCHMTGGAGKLAHHAGLQGSGPSLAARAAGLTEQSKALTSPKVCQFPSTLTAFIDCTEKQWKWVKERRGYDIISQKGVCMHMVNEFSLPTPPFTKQP